MTGRAIAAVAAAALLVLAGCTGGGTTTTAPGETTTVPDHGTTSAPDGTPADTGDTDSSDGDGSTGSDGDSSDGDGAGASGDGSGSTGSGDGGENDGSDPFALSLPNTSSVDATAGTVRAEVVETARSVAEYRVVVNQTIRTEANNVVQRATVNQSVAVERESPVYRVESIRVVQGRTISTAQYLVNGTVYSRSPVNVQQFGAEWTALNASNATESLREQDLLRRARQDLENASLSVEGGTTLDGTDVFVLRTDVNGSDFAEARGFGNTSTVHNVTGVYYLGQSDGRLHRYDLAINWTLSLSGREADQRIRATQRFTYPDVSVSLPSEATGAVDITDQVRDDTENETDGDESTGDTSTNETDDGGTAGDTTTNETDDGGTDADDGTASDDADGIAVRNGTLAVDPDRQFHRVEAELGVNVTDPRAVVIEEPLNESDFDDERDGDTEEDGDENGTDRLSPREVFGLDAESLLGTNVSVGPLTIPYRQVAEVRVSGLGNVYLRSSPSMPEPFVRLLATHEFVHYVQLQSGATAEVNGATDLTTDGRFVRRAILEGAATFTTDSILRANDSVSVTNSDLYAGIEAAVDPGSRNAYGKSQYVEGREYVDSRIDDPADLSQVYDSPPSTSEQVLHGLAPGSEPPAPLNVSADPGEGYVVAASDRTGEAYLRHVLANGVTLPRASAAAAGWGNDTLLTLRPTDGTNASYVWIHRWDDADEAGEFAAVVEAYLQEFGTERDGTTLLSGRPATLRRPGERTTALVVAPESLQDRLSVTVDGRTITVT